MTNQEPSVWQRFKQTDAYLSLIRPENVRGNFDEFVSLDIYDDLKQAREHYKKYLSDASFKRLRERYSNYKYRKSNKFTTIAVHPLTKARLDSLRVKMGFDESSIDTILEILCDARIELDPAVEKAKGAMASVEIDSALPFNKQMFALQKVIDYKTNKLITSLLEQTAREAYVVGRTSQRKKQTLDIEHEAIETETIRFWKGL